MSTTSRNTGSRLEPGNIYRANRAKGLPAARALDVARAVTATLDTLETFTAEFPYTERLDAVFSMEDTNAGVSLTYEIRRDYDGSPEDAECYGPEDITAWKADQWHYYGVTVTATMGTFTAEDSIWGIEGGDYWESPAYPLDAEQQVMSSALDYFSPRDMITAVQNVAIAACLQGTPNTPNTEG
jgi:hypothetical protein